MKSLFSLTWPIYIELALHMLTGVVNTFMIGHVEWQGVAKLAVGNQVFDVAIAVFSFASVGTSVVIAQYLGAERHERVGSVVTTSVAFNAWLGMLMTLSLMVFAGFVIQALNVPGPLQEDAKLYLWIVAICLVPEALTLCFAASLRAHGYAKDAMLIALVVNVITLIGNALLIYGWMGLPQLGVLGIAISTVVGRCVGVVLMGMRMQTLCHVRLPWNLLKISDTDALKKILRIGLPASGESLSWMLQFLVITAFVGLLGQEALSSHAYMIQIMIFVLLFSLALGLASEIRMAWRVGAEQYDEAAKDLYQVLGIGLCCAVLGSLFIIWQGRMIMGVFSDHAGVVETVSHLLIITLFIEPGRVFNLVIINSLRGVGDATFPLLVGIPSMWLLAIPLAWCFGHWLGLGLIGIWLALGVDEWTRGLIMLHRWRSNRWRGKRLA